VYAFLILIILVCISVRRKLTQFNTELRSKVQNTLGGAYCNLTNKMKEIWGSKKYNIFSKLVKYRIKEENLFYNDVTAHMHLKMPFFVHIIFQ